MPALNRPIPSDTNDETLSETVVSTKMLEKAERRKTSKSSPLDCKRNQREIFKTVEKTAPFNRFSFLPLTQGYSVTKVG